jgi:hypothetical protein
MKLNKLTALAMVIAMTATPLHATACAGWRALYAADIGRLNALARISADGRTKAHEDLFSKALKEMQDDGAASLADGCDWGD